MFGEIRTMTNEKGETYFVGKDVATALGYSKPLNAITMHVDEDDSLKWGLIDSKGRKQQAIFINESGLYSLVLSSKLPQAKAFKRWAPPTENDTRKYISDLCRLTGFGGKERLTENEWPRLVKQMALLESGMKLSEETVNKGYKLYKNTTL